MLASHQQALTEFGSYKYDYKIEPVNSKSKAIFNALLDQVNDSDEEHATRIAKVLRGSFPFKHDPILADDIFSIVEEYRVDQLILSKYPGLRNFYKKVQLEDLNNRKNKSESSNKRREVFIEKILTGSIIRDLDDDEMGIYREPFFNSGEDRRVMLSWPREIPIEGQPENVCKIVSEYSEWMSENNLPKLFINAEPGAIIQGSVRDFCRTWHNQSEITVEGIHFIQEDSPNEIGAGIKKWYQENIKDENK